jgi:cyclic beta-1,2-glucan synthetase
VAGLAAGRVVAEPAGPAEAPGARCRRLGQLRRIARRTWRYFERFVTAQDHWLPPDNVQEDSEPRIAHRTSPTNIGMGLLSTLAAHDLGYLGLVHSRTGSRARSPPSSHSSATQGTC